MKRMSFISLVITVIVSTPIHAASELAALSSIQEECVQVEGITFGAGEPWSGCRVTKGGWVSTIGLVDMYQAQYCLGNGKATCDQRALLLFGNRAYTPNAKLLAQRIDPGSTLYDDPLIIKNDYGRILVLSAHFQHGENSKSYYLWQADQWVLIDTKEWLQELSKLLPKGVAARKGGVPDVDTMNSRVSLYRNEDSDCCPNAGVANVELGLLKERFFLRAVSITDGK